MKNKDINKILRDNAVAANKSFYYQRYGKCNPQKCGSACCRFAVATEGSEYHQLAFAGVRSPVARIKQRKDVIIIFAFHCPNITTDGKCKLHNKKTQPEVCDKFPMTTTDAMYRYVKRYCRYYFKRVTRKKTLEKLTEVSK